MTHIPSSFARQDSAFSTEFDDVSLQSQATDKPKLSLFAWFRSQDWEPFCPDLLTEITVGLGRLD